MIQVYNSATNSPSSRDILKHFSTTPGASANRIEGMYSHQEYRAITSNGMVNRLSMQGEVLKSITLDEHIQNFSDFASKFKLYEFTADIKNPLRINDLWDDDPIGSAGPSIVDPDILSKEACTQLHMLFNPFKGVIHPHEIFAHISPKEVKKIKNSYANNALFQQEIKKRKARAKAIGEDFSSAQYQEIVWIDFTLKLRLWALEYGYDSFIYLNEKEGDNTDTIIPLKPNQIITTGKTMAFNKALYLDQIKDRVIQVLNRNQHSVGTLTHVLWAQEDPMQYWYHDNP